MLLRVNRLGNRVNKDSQTGNALPAMTIANSKHKAPVIMPQLPQLEISRQPQLEISRQPQQVVSKLPTALVRERYALGELSAIAYKPS